MHAGRRVRQWWLWLLYNSSVTSWSKALISSFFLLAYLWCFVLSFKMSSYSNRWYTLASYLFSYISANMMYGQEHIRTSGLSKSVYSNRSPWPSQTYWTVLKIEHQIMCLATCNDLCLQAAVQYVLLFLVLALNSNQFQILWSYNTFTQAVRSYVLLVEKSCPIHTLSKEKKSLGARVRGCN